MSDSEHDDEFEAYLKQGRPIHKSVSSPERLEPPPELDRIVIGNARKAIQGSSPARVYRAPRWALPTGLAATILISFAILLDLGVRAQRAEHEKRPAPAGPIASTPAAPPAREALAAEASQKPPAIPTTPWPLSPPAPKAESTEANKAPRTDAQQFQSPETARNRVARTEVAATRSRTAAESGAKEAAASSPIPAPAGATTVPKTAESAPDRPDPATRAAQIAWIAQIERLRAKGQTAEVEHQTKRFHETYPNYPLPGEAPSTDGRTQ